MSSRRELATNVIGRRITMSAVIINAPRYYTDDGWPAVTATITIGSRRHSRPLSGHDAGRAPARHDADSVCPA